MNPTLCPRCGCKKAKGELLCTLCMPWQYDYFERVAIRVIDGEQEEKEAEQKAMEELTEWWKDLQT
jgi:uncharacterized Zn finger protein (UPF0148 family)